MWPGFVWNRVSFQPDNTIFRSEAQYAGGYVLVTTSAGDMRATIIA